MFRQCDIPVCPLYIPFYNTLNKFSDYFTVQIYTEPVYSTGSGRAIIHADAAAAALSFWNFNFSPIWAFAPLPQTYAP